MITKLDTFTKFNKFDNLLCIHSDSGIFTKGKVYKILYKEDMDMVEYDMFDLEIEGNNNKTYSLELFIPEKTPDEIMNIFETLIFTIDKSYEDYIIRKESEKFNI